MHMAPASSGTQRSSSEGTIVAPWAAAKVNQGPWKPNRFECLAIHPSALGISARGRSGSPVVLVVVVPASLEGSDESSPSSVDASPASDVPSVPLAPAGSPVPESFELDISSDAAARPRPVPDVPPASTQRPDKQLKPALHVSFGKHMHVSLPGEHVA